MKDNYTHLSLVIDRSGSMFSIYEDMQGGINTLVSEQAQVDGDITVTLYQFDTEYEKVFGPVDASSAPKYSLVPRGGTALLDATGKAIVETGEFLSSLPEEDRPSHVVFVIVTDGEENSSVEYKRDQIKEMVQEQTNVWNWEFVYLGANVDKFAEAGSMGVSAAVGYQANANSVRTMYMGASASLTSLRSGATNTMAESLPEDF